MPPLFSPSLLLRRLRLIPSSSPARYFHRSSPSTSSSVARNLLKAKALPSLSLRGLDAGDSRTLLPGQAIGLVAAAQANFMRVIVESAGGAPDNPTLFGSDPRVGKELLCVVRELLKKLGRRVLVGDRVLVGSVAWDDRRGVIEDLYRRRSKVIDPPVANVDHLLLLFSMEQPKLEPFMLTRFLVEAESAGIPFTVALNKAELVCNQIASGSGSGDQPHRWSIIKIFRSKKYVSRERLVGTTTPTTSPPTATLPAATTPLAAYHLPDRQPIPCYPYASYPPPPSAYPYSLHLYYPLPPHHSTYPQPLFPP